MIFKINECVFDFLKVKTRMTSFQTFIKHQLLVCTRVS